MAATIVRGSSGTDGIAEAEKAALYAKWDELAGMIKSSALNPARSTVDRLITELLKDPRLGTLERRPQDCRPFLKPRGGWSGNVNLLAVAVEHNNGVLCHEMIQKAGLSVHGITCEPQGADPYVRRPASDEVCAALQHQLSAKGIVAKVTNRFSLFHFALVAQADRVAESLFRGGADIDSMVALQRDDSVHLNSPLVKLLSSEKPLLPLPLVLSMIGRVVNLPATMDVTLNTTPQVDEQGDVIGEQVTYEIGKVYSALDSLVLWGPSDVETGLITHLVNVIGACDDPSLLTQFRENMAGISRRALRPSAETNFIRLREAVNLRKTHVTQALSVPLLPPLAKMVTDFFNWDVPELPPSAL